MMEAWLFIARVFEGAVTWSEIKDATLDELSFLMKKAIEVNDQRASEARQMRSKMPRRGMRRR